MERASSFAELAKSVSDLSAVVQTLVSEVAGIKAHLATASVPQQVNQMVEPRPAPVLPFNGEPRLGKGFLSQCEITFRLQPSRFQSDESRVGFVAGAFTSRALEWYTAIAERTPELLHNYPRFRESFLGVFSSPTEVEDAAVKIHKIRQGNRSVSDYAVEFKVIAAQCDITDDSMRGAFYAGLSETIKQGLVNQYPSSFEELVNLSLRVDVRRRQLREESNSTHEATRGSTLSGEPMELGRSKQMPERRREGQQRSLCFFCGRTGHFAVRCPERLNSQAH